MANVKLMTTRNFAFKGSCDFMLGSTLGEVSILVSLTYPCSITVTSPLFTLIVSERSFLFVNKLIFCWFFAFNSYFKKAKSVLIPIIKRVISTLSIYWDAITPVFPGYLYVRSSTATASTCGVCGNISTGSISLKSYPCSLNNCKSLTIVAGLHEI